MDNKVHKKISHFAEQLLKFAQKCSSVNNHNFLELLALWSNQKRVVRLVATTKTYWHIEKFCAVNNLIYDHSAKKQATKTRTALGDIFTVSVDWEDPSGDFFVVIIGKTEEDVRQALEYENNDVSFELFGQLYQYPACCIESYSKMKSDSDWIYNYLVHSPIDISGYYQCNRLAVLFDESVLLPEFFPCHIACKETKKLGIQYEEILRFAGWNERLRKIQQSLKAPILIRHGILFQLVDSQICENLIKYKPLRDWQIEWRGYLLPDDLFYQSDSLTFSTRQIRFLSNGKVIGEESVDEIYNRVLLFN